jgi:hypothetical protein
MFWQIVNANFMTNGSAAAVQHPTAHTNTFGWPSSATVSAQASSSHASHTSHASSAAQSSPLPGHAAQSGHEELIRIFNTALIATQADAGRDFTKEIYDLMENPAFRAILSSVRQYARLQGLSERQAAEQIISTFRAMDNVWRDYVFQQGMDRIKNAT